MKKKLITSFTLIITLLCHATTWEEPWQKEIIEKSDCMVYGKVTEASDTIFKLKIEKKTEWKCRRRDYCKRILFNEFL